MQKAEPLPVRGRERRHVLPRGFKQRERADDVGFDERLGVIDRPIDMRFGREVHDRVGTRIREGAGHGAGVRDVGAHERRARVFERLLQVEQAARVRQLVDNDDAMGGFGERVVDEIGSDEAGSPGDKERRHINA